MEWFGYALGWIFFLIIYYVTLEGITESYYSSYRITFSEHIATVAIMLGVLSGVGGIVGFFIGMVVGSMGVGAVYGVAAGTLAWVPYVLYVNYQYYRNTHGLQDWLMIIGATTFVWAASVTILAYAVMMMVLTFGAVSKK